MGFSRGFGNRDTPTTHAACKRMWEKASSRKLAKGYLTLGANTTLWRDGPNFVACFHNNQIVVYYPGFKTINACGYSSSPTTQDRISRLAGVHMTSTSSLDCIQPVRVNGHPYFNDMRIDNYGHVLEEDQRPDYKTRPKKEVVQRYTTLFRRIEKMCLGRYELGEWEGPAMPAPGGLEALRQLEKILAEGETLLPSHLVRYVLPFHSTPTAPFRDLLKIRKETYRKAFYRANDGYETIEVK